MQQIRNPKVTKGKLVPGNRAFIPVVASKFLPIYWCSSMPITQHIRLKKPMNIGDWAGILVGFALVPFDGSSAVLEFGAS
jgi:hypothetical protein